MPQVNVTQLIGKTFFPRYNVRYYSVEDINNKGDDAIKSGVLQKNESFVMDSYLKPTESYKKYGLTYAKRSSMFFTFFKNGKYYGIKYDPNLYSLKKLSEQGTKTIQEQQQEQIESEKTPVDKITDIFQSGAGMVKN